MPGKRAGTGKRVVVKTKAKATPPKPTPPKPTPPKAPPRYDRRSPDTKDVAEGRGPRSPEVTRQQKKDRDAAARRRVPSIGQPTTAPRPRLTRDEEFELAIDIFMGKNDDLLRSLPNVRRANAWLGPIGYGEAGRFDPSDPTHWALLGPNLAMMTPFGRPLKATAASVAAARAALRGRSAGKAATEYMAGKGATRRASSWGAGKAADAIEKTGAKGLADFVRNSPEAKRWFKNEDSMVWVDPARSRTGRLAEKAYDAARPVLSKGPTVKGRRVAIAKTEREKWAQALEAQHHEAWKQAQRSLVEIDAALSHGVVNRLFKKLSVPDFYAIRMVGRGVDPETEVARFRGLAEQARAAGDASKAARHDYHAAMFAKAAPLVAVRGGDVVFSELASRKVREVYERIERAGKFREDIYANLDLLSEANAAARKTNDELWHYGATWQNTEKYIAKKLRTSTNRKAIRKLVKERHPDDPQAVNEIMATIDARARNAYELAVQNLSAGIERQRAKAAASNDPADQVLLRRMIAEAKRGIDPDIFYKYGETLTEIPDDAFKAAGQPSLAGGDPAWYTGPKTPHQEEMVNRGLLYADNIGVEFKDADEAGNSLFDNLSDDPDFRFADYAFTKATGGDYIDGFSEIAPFHAFPEERAAKNLQQKLNPKYKHGHPQNETIFTEIDGKQIAVAGDITPEQWVERVLHFMPNATERAEWAKWYDDFEPAFRNIFGEDADALMRGFAVSQANASPASGLRAVFKIMEALSQGKKVKRGYGSVVAANIAKAVEGGEIDSHVAAKLSDFIDSLMMKNTRTWMGDAAEGGRPVAVDVHAARDRGLIDPKMRQDAVASGRQGLEKRFGLVEGRDYAIDNNAGSPSGVMYERVAEWYENLTDHLNAIKFDGRTDWEPRQVQALGWATVQKLHGADPQDFAVALGSNTQRVSFGVTQGKGDLGASLSPEQAGRIAQALEPEMRALVEQAGGYLNGVTHSVDGWAGGVNAAVHLDVIGTDTQIQKLVTLLAQAFDQGLVQATRTRTAKGAKAALVIGSNDFGDEATKVAFMKRLYEVEPKLADHGFMADTYLNQPAVKIVTSYNKLTPKNVERFLARYRDAVAQVEQEMGLSVRYGTKNTEIAIGDQVGRRSYEHTSGRARSLERLDPTARAIRERLVGLIDEAGRGRPAGDGLASRGASRSAGDDGGRLDARAAADADAGRRLVESRPGYAEAAEQLRGGTVPEAWLNDLAEWGKDLHQYDKWRIGAHLDALVREGGGATIIGRGGLKSAPGLNDFLTQNSIRGMYRGPARQLIVTERGNVPTIIHELTHMAQDRNLLPKSFLDDVKQFLGVKGDEWTEQQYEELVDIVEATLMSIDAGSLRIPEKIKGPLLRLKADYLKADGKRAKDMMRRLDEDDSDLGTRLYDAVENLFFYHPRAGNKFHGASKEFRDRSKVYLPETLGLPASYGKGLFSLRSYYSRLGGLVGAKSNILPGDKALSHEFTAHLQESGAFDRNIIKGTIQAQMKAARIHAMSVIRAEARKIGHSTPVSSDDIAIPLDAVRFQGDQGKDIDFIAGMLNSIEDGKVINEAELDKVDLDAITQAADVLFPGATKATEAETKKLAEEIIAGVREPIEGVVWVNRQDLLNTAAFNTRSRSGGMRIAAGVNDYLKALLLTLKPSYIPMNFIGNTAMGLMQQGAFAPLNYARAWDLNRRLGDDAVLIDFFAGSGAMQSIFGARGGVPVVSPVLDKVTEVSGWLVDRHWRRASFLYEAGRMDYKTPDELRSLLKDPANVEDLTLISNRTKNAMVDFENLSTFEKDIMANAMFVYPWFKGATYWTGRFVKDHPLQATVYAYLLAQQQDRLNESLPEGHPGYLKWYLPIGTTERDGQEMPYGMRLDQALTFLTPADLAADAAAFASGGRVSLFGESEPEAMASKLNPLYEELLKTITGYDSFTGQPVDQGVPDLLMRLLPGERSVAWQQVLSIMDEGKRNRSMYHPTEKEAWLKLFFGSLAPGAVDPAKAGERAKGLRQTRTDDENLDLWQAKAERAFGEKPPEWLVEYKRVQQRYNDLESEYESELGYPEGGMSKQERTVVLFRLMAERDGREWNREDEILALDDDTVDSLYRDLRRDLGLTQIDAFDRDIGERRKEQRLNG